MIDTVHQNMRDYLAKLKRADRADRADRAEERMKKDFYEAGRGRITLVNTV